MGNELYDALVLAMSDWTVEPVLVLPLGSSQYRAQYLIDHIWPLIYDALGVTDGAAVSARCTVYGDPEPMLVLTEEQMREWDLGVIDE